MMAAASVALGGGGGEGGEGGGGEGGRGGRGGGGGGGSSRKDFISDLPAELGVLILSQLDIKDLFRSSAVCQRWRKLTIHYDFLYGPHLIKKHDHVTHGRDPITASRAGMSQELLQRYPKLSASEYFASPKSLRDLALRDLYLLKRWNAGIPTRTINLNTRRAPEHAAVILSVLVDPVYKILISGDKSGKVVFWSTHTERPVRSIELRDKEPITSNDPAISAMALGTDYLVIGTWVNSSPIYIYIRTLLFYPAELTTMGYVCINVLANDGSCPKTRRREHAYRYAGVFPCGSVPGLGGSYQHPDRGQHLHRRMRQRRDSVLGPRHAGPVRSAPAAPPPRPPRPRPREDSPQGSLLLVFIVVVVVRRG